MRKLGLNVKIAPQGARDILKHLIWKKTSEGPIKGIKIKTREEENMSNQKKRINL